MTNKISIKHVLYFENPLLPFFSSSSESTSKIILNHSVEVTSNSSPAQVALDLDSIEIFPNANINQSNFKKKNKDGSFQLTNWFNNLPAALPSLKLPLIGPNLLRRGYFEVLVDIILISFQ